MLRQVLRLGNTEEHMSYLISSYGGSEFISCVDGDSRIVVKNLQAYFEGPGPPKRQGIQGALLLCGY